MFHEGKVHFRVTSGDAGYVLPLNIATTAIGFIPLFGDAVSVLELIRGGLSDDTVISAAEAWFEKTGRVKGYIKYDIVKRLRLPNKRKFVECLKTGALDELECNYYRDDAKEDHDEDIEETIDAFEDKYQDQIFDN
jgi:hypothetical protein